MVTMGGKSSSLLLWQTTVPLTDPDLRIFFCMWPSVSPNSDRSVTGCVRFPPTARNVGSRGGPGAGLGPVTNSNRSTEDLRMKQQSANYGRLRESLFACMILLYCKKI